MIACCCRGAFLAAMVFVAGCTPPPQRAAFVAAEPKEDTAAIALKDLPRMQWREYRVDPYIRAAAKLQGLGKDKAVEALSALARSTRQSLGDGDDEVMVLCRLLFVPRPGKEFRGPILGQPAFLGRTDSSDWPLVPMEVVDGVPFCIVGGYTLAGRAELASQYLDYCVSECDWNSHAYTPKSSAEKQGALAKLLASPKWKGGPEAQDKEYLEAQIK